MAKNRYAVIDLGTNTFHLLVVEAIDGHRRRLYKERIFVQLAENGIETIGEAPMQRAMDALTRFKGELERLDTQQINAFGTAALRTASNGNDLVRFAAENLNIPINIIPGKEEARLIHLGVMEALGKRDDRLLMMDIGGGSVEFIIADNDQVFWSESFPIGVAVLFRAFHHSDPIDTSEVRKLDEFLQKTLVPLTKALKDFPCPVLVGASGTFDVLENILPHKRSSSTSVEINAEDVLPLYHELLASTVEERMNMNKIPKQRIKLIVVAIILIRHVMELAKTREILVSAYAMKEGILQEMIDKNNNIE